MKHIFSPAGEIALRTLVRPDTLIAFDDDGTLSPIVALPEKARTTAGAARSMRLLCELCNVAILTGRSVSDAHARLGFVPRFLIGNHGLEGLPGREAATERARELCLGWLQQLRLQHAEEAVLQGVTLEDKGASISIHYRLARDRSLARDEICRRMVRLSPVPKVIGGHFVFNLLPAEAMDKGMALNLLLKSTGCRNAMFVGDDETDEAVFSVAAHDWLTVRVGYRPDSAARFFLHRQMEMVPFLLRIITALQTARRRDMRAGVGYGGKR